MIGIYRVVCLVNGLSYIGQSKDIEKRWRQHDIELYKRQHHSKKLQYDYDIYGSQLFVKFILKTFNTYDRNLLNAWEKFFIKEYNSFNIGYNGTKGG